MKPVNLLADTLSVLLAADTTYLANATAMKVGLITAPFTPSIDRLMGDLTISAVTNLTPIAGVAGTQENSKDPVTGELIVEVKPPAGGFRWNTGSGFPGPVTVYGFALGNGAMNLLYGTESLPTPIILTADFQTVEAPSLTFRIDSTQIK